MATTEEIRDYLNSEYNFVKPYKELANNDNITSELLAYDYDAIKDKIAKARCTSADALHVGKFIHFIEFKTGFAGEKSDANERTHKENLKLRIRLKAYESLALFEKVILPDVSDGVLNQGIQKGYIAVVDSNEEPMKAYTDVLAAESGYVQFHKEQRKQIFESTLLNYRKTVKNGTRALFYDQVDVWYDFEFDDKVKRIK